MSGEVAVSLEEHRVRVLAAQRLVPADALALAAGRRSPAIEQRIDEAIARLRRLIVWPIAGALISLVAVVILVVVEAPQVTFLAGMGLPIGVLGALLNVATGRSRAARMRAEVMVVEGRARKGFERRRRFIEIGGVRTEDEGPVVVALHGLLIAEQPYRAYLAPGPFLLAVEPLPAAPTLLRAYAGSVVAFDDEE